MKFRPLIAFALLHIASHAQAATFQKTITLACDSIQCNGTFAKVPAGKTLVVKTVSCFMDYSANPVTASGFLTSGSGNNPFRQHFPLTLTSDGVALSGVVPAAMTVSAGKSPTATIVFPASSSVAIAQCSLRGTIN